MPPWSVRIDPFNWILRGRLGLELEVGLLSFMSVELIPVFVTNSSNYLDGIRSPLQQESNGLGALSGISIDAGFWLGGKPFKGYVLRAIYENYGYTYKVTDGTGAVADRLSHTDRVLMGMLGSVSRIGVFTIAGGLGLGVDLNKEERCYVPGQDFVGSPTGRGCGNLELSDGTSRYNVASFLYPAVLEFRFSLGVSID